MLQFARFLLASIEYFNCKLLGSALMSRLEDSLEKAVYSLEDACSIVNHFNRLYAGAVYPPLEELQTHLLVTAVEAGHAVLVEKLLNNGYPVNYKFGYASPSPLHAAVDAGNVDLLRILLSHGASVNLVSRATVRQSDKVSKSETCLLVTFFVLTSVVLSLLQWLIICAFIVSRFSPKWWA